MQNKFNLPLQEIHDIYCYVYGESSSVHDDASSAYASSTHSAPKPASTKPSASSNSFFNYAGVWYQILSSTQKEAITDILHGIPDRPHDCVYQIQDVCDVSAAEIIDLYKSFTNNKGVFIDAIEVCYHLNSFL